MFPFFLSSVVTLKVISLVSSTTVKYLYFLVIFHQNLSFDAHIKQVSTTAFFHLRNTTKVRNIHEQKLVYAFVISRLDYCNSLILGCPKNSQKSIKLIITKLHHTSFHCYIFSFALRLQVYLWFPEFLKVKWEADPSVIRPLSVEPAVSLASGSRHPLYL